MGYVLTAEVLADLRVFLQRATGAREALVKRHALDLLGHLDHADSLDAKRLHELATWAREQARERDASSAHRILGADDAPFDTVALGRVMAEDSRIIEISTDVLTALALDSLPAGAVLNIGRDEEQVNAKSPRFHWPGKAERAASIGPVGMSLRIDTSPGGDECHLCQAAIADEDAATCTSAGCPRRAALEVEPAANGKMSRAQFEALPSHDRVVLGQILATLRGEPITREPLDGPAVDVLVELDQYMHTIDSRLEALAERAADGFVLAVTAPRYSLPESHPLRQYQWSEWLEADLRAEVEGNSSPFYRGHASRQEWLAGALARVRASDVDGLRGMVERAHDAAGNSPVSADENDLLLFACQSRHVKVRVELVDGALRAGCHRVPRVRGETAEVGK
jgi:hypothetical protein